MYEKISNAPWNKFFDFLDFSYFDNIFDNKELQLLNCIFSNVELEKGKIGTNADGGIVSENVRKSNVNFIYHNDDNNWIFDRFNSVIEISNKNYFNLDLIGYDHIQYSEYNSAELGEYNFHMDMGFGKNYLTRKLSLAFLLNDDFEGGEFEINIGAENNSRIVETRKNRAILFPSFIIHRVRPVTKGVRKSLVIWVLGPKIR